MSSFAALTLKNNALADVVFNPQSIDPEGVAKWLDANSIFDAKRSVTMRVSLPKNGGQVARIKQRVMIPVMDSVDTSKKIAEAYINIESVVPKQASEQVRLDLRAFGGNLLDNAVSTAAFTSLEAIF